MNNPNWTFFTPEDRDTIRRSAGTNWGLPIVENLKKTVEERMKHSMRVPEKEAGHFHHYFCPDHKRILEFDWESPNRHYCPDGDHYLEGKQVDDAWINLVHTRNQNFLFCSALLHMIFEEMKYLHPIRWMLLEYAERYPHYKLHGHDMNPAWYGGNMICQTLDESVWATYVTVAFLEVLPILSAEEAEKIRQRLFRPMADRIFSNRAGGNWQVWHNSGLVHIGIVLEDPVWIRIALDDPKCGYRTLLSTDLTAEGWWGERSPGYHFYPLSAMVRTAEALRCRKIDLYDDRLKSMFRAPVEAVYPDLSFPAHNDGWHGTSLVNQASQYEMAALRFGDELFRTVLRKAYARGERIGWDALLNGQAIEPDPGPLELPSLVQADTGVAFLRSGNRAVVLKYGPYGGGHGHPDKLSISIHDGTEEIVPDLGTTGYGVPDHGAWYRKTLSHSTVVVDETDQAPVTGTLIDFTPAPDGGFISAECREAYPGVLLRRSLTLRDGILEDEFLIESNENHSYDYVLILSKPPVIPGDGTPARLPERVGYDRIRDAEERSVEKEIAVRVGTFQLTLAASEPFTLVTGTAPGIPGSFRHDSTFRTCHPLIVRTSGRNVTFRGRWEFQG